MSDNNVNKKAPTLSWLSSKGKNTSAKLEEQNFNSHTTKVVAEVRQELSKGVINPLVNMLSAKNSTMNISNNSNNNGLGFFEKADNSQDKYKFNLVVVKDLEYNLSQITNTKDEVEATAEQASLSISKS